MHVRVRVRVSPVMSIQHRSVFRQSSQQPSSISMKMPLHLMAHVFCVICRLVDALADWPVVVVIADIINFYYDFSFCFLLIFSYKIQVNLNILYCILFVHKLCDIYILSLRWDCRCPCRCRWVCRSQGSAVHYYARTYVNGVSNLLYKYLS